VKDKFLSCELSLAPKQFYFIEELHQPK